MSNNPIWKQVQTLEDELHDTRSKTVSQYKELMDLDVKYHNLQDKLNKTEQICGGIFVVALFLLIVCIIQTTILFLK